MLCVKEKGNGLLLVRNVLTGQTILTVSIVQTPLGETSGEGSREFWEVCRKELECPPSLKIACGVVREVGRGC